MTKSKTSSEVDSPKMVAQLHCPVCKATFGAPRERMMPDRVMEYRCPTCMYQIPLLAPGLQDEVVCSECAAGPTPTEAVSGVDSTGLLNFLLCGVCGCLLGRYWGMMRL